MKDNKLKLDTTKSKVAENLFALSVLILFFIQFLVFWVYGNFNSIKLAFMEYNATQSDFLLLPLNRFFDNFVKFFNEIFSGAGFDLVLNGAYFHILSSFICLPFSYMLAYIIYKKLPGSGFFKVVLYLPAILSSMVMILLFKHLIESGIDGFITEVFKTKMPFVFRDPKYNRLVISVYVIFFGLPGSLLVNLGSMSRVPHELVEYGELEGISLWKEFCLITVPMVFPVLQVQCLGLFAGFFTAQGPLFVFYDNDAPKNLQTFGYYLFIQVGRNADGNEAAKYMYGYSSAASLTIGLVSIPIVQATKLLFDKLDPGAEF